MERIVRLIDGVVIAESDAPPEEHPALERPRLRCEAALRALARRHALLAAAVAVVGSVAVLSAGRGEERALMALVYGAAALHLLVYLPIKAAVLAGDVVDAARGSSPDSCPMAELAAIPDFPRPVCFHYLRAALAPIRGGEAFAFATLPALPYLLPLGCLMAKNIVAGVGIRVSGAYEYVTRPLDWVPAIAFLLIFFYAIAIAAAVATRLAVGWVVGWRAGLGQLAPAVLLGDLGLREAGQLAAAENLDEEWGRDAVANAAGFATESARRIAAMAAAFAFFAVVAAAAWILPAWVWITVRARSQGTSFEAQLNWLGSQGWSGFLAMLFFFGCGVAGVCVALFGARRMRNAVIGDHRPPPTPPAAPSSPA